jgi:AraC-like DNA-binding protein
MFPSRGIQPKFLFDRVPRAPSLFNLGLSVDISPGVFVLDKRVEKIIAMMREDVRGELSLSEFAQSVNLSVWRLCHIFKSDVGMPPIRYLRLLRMERAKDLLESSFLSVKEIAFQVGLNDESHFVRDFKSTYGFSPALYRTHFKNNHAEAHHGNGNNGSNGTNPNKLQQDLARAAKSSLLPSVHLVICMVSYLS